MDYFVFHGRMQPIHAGHVAALKMLDEAAKSVHGKAFISLTGTQDPESNPLPFEKKYKYVKAAVESWGLDITVLDKATFKIYDLMRDMSFDCQKEGGGTVHLFAGEDRIESYQKMADSMIKKYQSRGECLDVKVSVEQTMTRDDSIAYSATQMRQHVKDNDLEEFIKHCPFSKPTTDERGLCEEMFHDLAVGMGLEEDTSEKGDPYEVTEMMAKKISEHINQMTGQPDKLYYIGGCVRDLVMGKKPNDLDLVTTMYYKDFAEMFKTNDIRFRGQNIIVVPVIQGEGYETACLPKEMTLDYRIEHSDLTMNSMVKDILTGEIYDPLGGQQDIKNNILRCTDFMIDAFGQGQQPVAVLRTIRFYSINEMTLDPASDDALHAFSTATKGKLKVTERQFEKDWHKVEKNGRQQKFIDKVKELGLYDNLVKTQPAFAAYVNGGAAPIKESLNKRISRFFEAFSMKKNKNIEFEDKDLFKDCEWLNSTISKGDFCTAIISILSEIKENEGFKFRESPKMTTELPVIDCTLEENPTADNVPTEFGKFFVKADLRDDVNVERAKTALVGFIRNNEFVNVAMAKQNPHAVKLLYIVLRPHQESGKGQQSFLTPLQEMIQGKAIIEKATNADDLFNKIVSQDKEFKSITLNDEKITIKDIESVDLEKIVKNYCTAAIKTSKAFYTYFGNLDGLKCYHPDGKQNNILKTLIKVGSSKISGAKDAWNPTDILITKGLEYNTAKKWFEAASNISELNLIIKVLMLKTLGILNKAEEPIDAIADTVTSPKLLEIIKQIQEKDDLVFIPVSLKLNYSQEDSHVETLNLYKKGEMHVNSHTDVIEAGQGFEFHAVIDNNDYKFTVRTNGPGVILETANGKFDTIAKKAQFHLEAGETDIHVSKETKNTSSQLGKSWQALKNFCPQFDNKDFGQIQKMTREVVGHDTIQWDRGEAFEHSLPRQLHMTWEKHKNTDNENTLAAAMFCNRLAYYIIYNKWNTAEALIYVLNASMKSNYGAFTSFAPYFKIS